MSKELSEVKRKLAALRKEAGRACYILSIDPFSMYLYTNAEFSDPPNKELPLTSYKAVTVELWEKGISETASSHATTQIGGKVVEVKSSIDLWKDYRFADFWEEVKWTDNEFNWKFGNLVPMPIVYELVNQVDRIVELTPFH